MLELLRSKARAAMEQKGYTRPNKLIRTSQGHGPSIFAQRWLEFI